MWLSLSACGGLAAEDPSAPFLDASGDDNTAVDTGPGSDDGSAGGQVTTTEAGQDADGTAPRPDAGANSDAAEDAAGHIDADAGVDADANIGADGPTGGDADASADATVPIPDGGPDATLPPTDASVDVSTSDAIDPNPLAKCQSGMRDVFYVNVAEYPGPFQFGPQTFTNLDSNFSATDELMAPLGK
jgi:hypothetical protein